MRYFRVKKDMKNLLHTALTALLIIFKSSTLDAQGCAIDYNQTMVGIYPTNLPPATVGAPYNTDITFVLPTDTLGYPFTNFQIVSINLPLGLNWSCNEALNNCNYNPQFDVYGCIHISGVPLVAGNFQVDISILADLTILQGYPYQFNMNFTVNPAVILNNSGAFDFQVSQPCAPALVTFFNQEPGLLLYQWDFGNGATSTTENPGPQYYPNAGNFPIQYTAYDQLDTTIAIQLTQLDLQQMSNYGENFPSFEEADPYFKIKKNGQVVYQSTVIIDQNPPLSWWPNINLELGQDYIIEIWEADQSIGENYFGADDYIGNHTLNLGSCTGCFAGSSQIAYQINIQNINPIPTIEAADTLHLFDSPDAPSIIADSSTHSFTSSNPSNYLQWYHNGQALIGQNNTQLIAQETGYYHVLAFNEHGCANSSETLFITVDLATVLDNNSAGASFNLSIDQLTKQLCIELTPELVGAQIELWQIDGRLIDAWKSVQRLEKYPIDLLTSGIYLVKLSKGNLVKESKISIVR